MLYLLFSSISMMAFDGKFYCNSFYWKRKASIRSSFLHSAGSCPRGNPTVKQILLFLMYWTPVHREVYNIHLCFGIVVKFTLRIPFLRAFETETSGRFIAFCHAFRGASVMKPWGFLVLNNQVGMTFNLKSTTKESFSFSIFSFVTWWLSNMIQNVIINKKLQRFPRWCLFALPRTD